MIVSGETMNVEDHLKNLKESVDIINECIQKGILERKRNIGFNASAGAVDMLEAFLHRKSLIDPGFMIKHEWFNSKKKTKEKFNFDFPEKEEIIRLISIIEGKRSLLFYGKPQKEETIREVIDNFNKLKDKFKELGLNGI